MSRGRNLGRVIVDDTGEISASNLGAVPPTPEVLTPSNTSPANAATDIGETPTLTASTFYSLYGFTHAKSQWQVSTVSDFASTVVSTGDVDDLTSYTVAGGVLSTSTTYYWRVRYKDSNGSYSAYSTATTFTTNAIFDFSVDYLVVAGAGGGGRARGGGGGAGGLRSTVTATGGGGTLESALTVSPATNYTVTVGGGGAGTVANTPGVSGSNSVFSTITSVGGGGGSGNYPPYGGLNGGSGGGANDNALTTIGYGTANQGYNGGEAKGGGNGNPGGGGGGAGQVGGTPSSNTDVGNGGNGVAVSITGSSVTYAGGGGGGTQGAIAGAGGAGGGGAGGPNNFGGTNGTANKGSGGGGAGDGSSGPGGNGGSGVVILKYPDTVTISNSGGGLTFSTATSGGYSVTTFTAGTGNVSWS